MYCRVFDQPRNTYYRSIVYGILSDARNASYIVLNPLSDCFELIPQYPDGDDLQPPLVALIQCDQESWKSADDISVLLPLKHHLQESGVACPFEFLFGYPEVCQCMPFIAALIAGQQIPASQYDIPLRSLTDADAWHYLHTQADADALMRRYEGFHDAFLMNLLYREASGTSRIDYKEPGPAQMIATYDIYHEYGCIELCFEGVLHAQLQPALEHSDRLIFCASLHVSEEAVLWREDEEGSTCIKALSAKWRAR